MTGHLWICEYVDIRHGDSYGCCSCGWRSKGYQASKDAWRRHVAIAARKAAQKVPPKRSRNDRPNPAREK